MKTRTNKPYTMAGAGRLTASIWKAVDSDSGSTYGFNIFPMEARTGRVTHRLKPTDIPDLIKLARVLAQVLIDDGSLATAMRRRLQSLAESIDRMLDDEGKL